MKNFTGERREFRGGKPGFQKKSWESKDKQMYKATCSECGKPCEVPFRPDGSKPVFCNDCFNKKRDPSDTRGRSEYTAPKRDYNDRSARSDFRSDTRPAFKPSNDNGKQLSEISMKLDRLIAAMEKMSAPKAALAAAPKAEKVTAPKAAKPARPQRAGGKVAKKKVVAKKKK